MFEVAQRIVEIQRLLGVGRLDSLERANLISEQRILWDEVYPGRSFDVIESDAKRNQWLVKDPARL